MMLEDLKLDTVDFVPNYDERHTEPTVLPSKFPNLLVNGCGRHRGRHGDVDPAAQPGRSLPRHRRADRQSAHHRARS